MASNDTSKTGFTQAERDAMNARSRELATEKRANKKRADGEQAVLKAIGEMPEDDARLARKIHELVSQTLPELWPKTWYGMPAYAIGGKQVVCFFQAAAKFGARYATFGFNDEARIDDGTMWATSFGITEINEAEEQQIVELLKRALPEKGR